MTRKHIIHKVYLELQTNSTAKAYEIKDNISSYLNLEVFPSLEKELNALENKMPNYAVQVDRLVLEVSNSEISLNSSLKNAIHEAFKVEAEAAIQEVSLNSDQDIKEKKGIVLNKEEHVLNTFIYFLEKGINPWWSDYESTPFLHQKEVYQAVLNSPDFTDRILKILPLKQVQERLINQLTDIALQQLYEVICKCKKIKLNVNKASVSYTHLTLPTTPYV